VLSPPGLVGLGASAVLLEWGAGVEITVGTAGVVVVGSAAGVDVVCAAVVVVRDSVEEVGAGHGKPPIRGESNGPRMGMDGMGMGRLMRDGSRSCRALVCAVCRLLVLRVRACMVL